MMKSFQAVIVAAIVTSSVAINEPVASPSATFERELAGYEHYPTFVPTVSRNAYVWLLLMTLADDTENLGMDYYSGSFALGLSFGRR